MTTAIALFLGIATGLAFMASRACRTLQPIRTKQGPADRPSQGKQ